MVFIDSVAFRELVAFVVRSTVIRPLDGEDVDTVRVVAAFVFDDALTVVSVVDCAFGAYVVAGLDTVDRLFVNRLWLDITDIINGEFDVLVVVNAVVLRLEATESVTEEGVYVGVLE